MLISPSIASADVCNIQREVEFAERYFSHIHLDLEDGVYLPNMTFGMKTVKGICRFCRASVSVHLQVQDPMQYLKEMEGLAIDDVFIHTDHLENPEQVITAFQKKGFHTGLGLSNRDLNRDLTGLLDQVDSVLVLSALIEDPLQQYSETLDRFSRELAAKGRWQVWVDGGVMREMIPHLEREGIYAAVMGRAIFQDKETAMKTWLKNGQPARSSERR